MLIPIKHSGYQAGIRLYPGGGKGGGGSSAPPPDPRLIEAQIKSMGIQDDSIQEILAMSRKLAPLQEQQMQFGIDSAKTAYDQSQSDRTFALAKRDQLSTIQDGMVTEAKAFNAEAEGDVQAAKATADVNTAFASARGQSARDLARRGINPGSGAALALDNQIALGQATATAGAENNARTGARAEGRALTDRASNSLAGYPSMATGGTMNGAGLAASGLNIANTGLAGLNSGSVAAGGAAGSMGSNAAQMYGTMGNYKTAQDKLASDDNGFMGALGVLGGAAITKYSDRRLKERIELVGRDEDTGLNLYEFSYITNPTMRFRGVMADEVLACMPEAVVETSDGYLAVDYGLLGIEMVEV